MFNARDIMICEVMHKASHIPIPRTPYMYYVLPSKIVSYQTRCNASVHLPFASPAVPDSPRFPPALPRKPSLSENSQAV